MLSVDQLSLSYGAFQALDQVSFEVNKGECIALLGPNGAGKTSLFKIILGLLKPSSGKIEILGRPPGHLEVKQKLACTPQQSEFPDFTKTKEILSLLSKVHPQGRSLNEIISELELESLLEKEAQKMSGGQKRALGLACALMGNPEFLLLDEPTVGLDIEKRDLLWKQVLKVKRGGATILLTTHHLEEAEHLADRVFVLNRGRVLFGGAVSEIKQKIKHKRLSFQAAPGLKFSGRFSDQVIYTGEQNNYQLTSEQTDDFIQTELLKHQFSNLNIEPVSLQEAINEILKKDPS